jgi:uncharacterized membrane protein
MKKFFLRIKTKGLEQLEVGDWLLLSVLFCLILLTYQVVTTARVSYIFLGWNLFLASIPYFISSWLMKNESLVKKRFVLIPAIGIWLLFMPNSFYIITDLFHLDTMRSKKLWFELTMIFSFAWTGILFGIISIMRMEKILRPVMGKYFSPLLICLVMWLNAFGVYIGRYLRFNSWDVISDPVSLFGEVGTIIFNPFDHRWVWAMTVCFTVFMLIVYYTVKKVAED